MSEYCSVKTQFKNEDALIAALMETGGWTREQIEVHQQPVNLHGYHGDQREQDAHIVIRRQFVGGASNDIGFLRSSSGEYQAWISQYDHHRYGATWQQRLRQNYAFHAIRVQQEARGRTVSRERLPGGKQMIVIGGYR